MSARPPVAWDERSDEHLRDACGVVGIFGPPEAANLAYLGLHALQHRGQESAGIATSDGTRLHHHRGEGLVTDVFSAPLLGRLPGPYAIGHVRYSTAGGSGLQNAQPITARYGGGMVAVAHNGNLTNAAMLRRRLEAEGSIFQGTTDTEVIVHLFARSRASTPEGRLMDALRQIEGAWSLTVLTEDKVIGVRDPLGVRPLVLGRLAGGHVLASETCALPLLDATFEREVEPGEMVVIDAGGVTSRRYLPETPRRACVFEHVYFARPDSTVFGRSVYGVRRALGQRLAQEAPASADVVIPVPDSGLAAAIGFAEASGIPYGMGLVRSHYVGRTFIEPTQAIRHFGVKLKLAPVEEVIAGRRVVVLDDSLVRGTTSRKIINMLRGAGAREVHLRISSPPITHPCFYGIDTPSRAELVAAQYGVEEIRAMLGCESLAFLSEAGLLEAARDSAGGFCDACFTGRYPIPLTDALET
ncbi:amidophosphoribosyltransferase [Myxococcota bacterium]|nr:amidophosphoribosyltransferase [Myxococcota bacterium]